MGGLAAEGAARPRLEGLPDLARPRTLHQDGNSTSGTVTRTSRERRIRSCGRRRRRLLVGAGGDGVAHGHQVAIGMATREGKTATRRGRVWRWLRRIRRGGGGASSSSPAGAAAAPSAMGGGEFFFFLSSKPWEKGSGLGDAASVLWGRGRAAVS